MIGRKSSDDKLAIFLDVVFSKFGSVKFELPRKNSGHLKNVFLFTHCLCVCLHQKSSAVKVTHFNGCMGEAFLNGQSIGLWNYIEREGECHGCFGR